MDLTLGPLGEELRVFAQRHLLPVRVERTAPFYERFRNHEALGAWGRVPVGMQGDGTESFRSIAQVQPRMLRGGDGRLRVDYVLYPHVFPCPIELLQLRSAERDVFYRSSYRGGIDHLVIDDCTGDADAYAAIARLGILEKPASLDFRSLAFAAVDGPVRTGFSRASGIAPYTPSAYISVADTVRALADSSAEPTQLRGHLFDGPTDPRAGLVRRESDYRHFFGWAAGFFRLA